MRSPSTSGRKSAAIYLLNTGRGRTSDDIAAMYERKSQEMIERVAGASPEMRDRLEMYYHTYLNALRDAYRACSDAYSNKPVHAAAVSHGL